MTADTPPFGVTVVDGEEDDALLVATVSIVMDTRTALVVV